MFCFYKCKEIWDITTRNFVHDFLQVSEVASTDPASELDTCEQVYLNKSVSYTTQSSSDYQVSVGISSLSG